jgi:hypothetical protein
VLQSLKVTVAAGATEAQVFTQLNAEIAKAFRDPSVIDKLMDAFKLK